MMVGDTTNREQSKTAPSPMCAQASGDSSKKLGFYVALAGNYPKSLPQQEKAPLGSYRCVFLIDNSISSYNIAQIKDVSIILFMIQTSTFI